MQLCIYIYIVAYTPTITHAYIYIHSCIHTYKYIYIVAYTPTRVLHIVAYTHTPTCIQIKNHTCIRTRSCTPTLGAAPPWILLHANMQTYTSYPHPYIIHTYIRTHSCTPTSDAAPPWILNTYICMTREVGGWGRDPFSRNLMSPTPRRKWYLTTGRRAH